MVLCKTLKNSHISFCEKNSVAFLHESNLIPEFFFPYVSLKILSYIFHLGEKFSRQHVELTDVKKKIIFGGRTRLPVTFHLCRKSPAKSIYHYQGQ